MYDETFKKVTDPTDASANASVDTPPTRRSTHYQHISQHTTDTSADTLPTHSSKILPFVTLILLRLSVGSKNVIRKDENMKAKQPPF